MDYLFLIVFNFCDFNASNFLLQFRYLVGMLRMGKNTCSKTRITRPINRRVYAVRPTTMANRP